MSLNIMDEDQSKFLDNALRNIKSIAYQMKLSIDKNDMRQCLKSASEMLSELKTSLLTPKNYYQLYTEMLDEIQYLQSYFREEVKRGRRARELYEAVQQSISIIPRCYLMITVGTIFIESNQCDNSDDIIYDGIQGTKGVQNPLRGGFSRYFLLKMLKDYFGTVPGHAEKTGEFLLDNGKDMNRLWIRMSNSNNMNQGNEKIVLGNRNDLKVLVGENITRGASLPCLTIDGYSTLLLPQGLKLAIESNDSISQEYGIECIIHAFPDEFNINSLNNILSSIPKFHPSVDIKSIFITIMDKLSKYVNEPDNFLPSSLDNKGGVTDKKKIATDQLFEILRTSLTNLINDSAINSGSNSSENAAGVDIMKLIELQIAFGKFTIKFATNENGIKAASINNIMESSELLGSKTIGDRKMSQSGIKLILKLLTTALESPISIFKIQSFPDLMNYLDDASKNELSLKIIDSLVNEYNIGSIDTKEKMENVLEFVKPLVQDNSGNESQYHFENQMVTLSKIIYVPSSRNPEEQMEMLHLIKDVFSNASQNKSRALLPVLVNAYINLGYSISEGVNYSGSKGEGMNNIKISFSTKYNLNAFDINNLDSFSPFYKGMYTLLDNTIESLIVISPETSFKLYLEVANQINGMKIKREDYEEQCYACISKAVNLLVEGKIPLENKFKNLMYLIGDLLAITILTNENMNKLVQNTFQITQNLMKRNEQCTAMGSCAKLFYNNTIQEPTKVVDCGVRAKKYADYAMTSPNNAILFVSIINEYFNLDNKIPDFASFASSDAVNDIIEYLRNYLATMKSEDKIGENEHKIEKYFQSTLELIKRRQIEYQEQGQSATKRGIEKILTGG